MATTTSQVTFQRTITYQFSAQFPGQAALTDAEALTVAGGAGGTFGILSLGELMAGSTVANQGAISKGSWSVVAASNKDVVNYSSWSASAALAVGDRIIPTTPSANVYTVTTAGTTGATEGTATAVAATATVSGGVYKIATVGTTDFTLIGSLNNTVGTVFLATGAGTGSGATTLVWPASGSATSGMVTFSTASKFV